MTQVEAHIEYLLYAWLFVDRIPCFVWQDFFSISHRDGVCSMYVNHEHLISCVPLPDDASLSDVHHALRDLFDHVPRYNVLYLQEPK